MLKQDTFKIFHWGIHSPNDKDKLVGFARISPIFSFTKDYSLAVFSRSQTFPNFDKFKGRSRKLVHMKSLPYLIITLHLGGEDFEMYINTYCIFFNKRPCSFKRPTFIRNYFINFKLLLWLFLNSLTPIVTAMLFRLYSTSWMNDFFANIKCRSAISIFYSIQRNWFFEAIFVILNYKLTICTIKISINI